MNTLEFTSLPQPAFKLQVPSLELGNTSSCERLWPLCGSEGPTMIYGIDHVRF